MKSALPLGTALVGTAVFTAVAAHAAGDAGLALASGLFLAAGASTPWLRRISLFLQFIFAFFAGEAMVVAVLVGLPMLWPGAAALSTIPLGAVHVATLILFSILMIFVDRIPLFQRMFAIGDLYLAAQERFSLTWLGPLAFPIREATFARLAIAASILLGQLGTVLLILFGVVGQAMGTALEGRDAATFWHALLVQTVPLLAAQFLQNLLSTIVTEGLGYRWDLYVTGRFVGRWIGDGRHYRLSLLPELVDNPDQRIHEDISPLCGLGPTNGYGFLINAVQQVNAVTAVAGVLWTLSAGRPVPGLGLEIPGFFFWVAILWSVLPAILLFYLSKPIARLTVRLQVASANFRFGLARIREHGEQIALMQGGAVETRLSDQRLHSFYLRRMISTCYGGAVMQVGQTLILASTYLNTVALAPFYFANMLDFGTFTMAGIYFQQVSSGVSFFAQSFANFAEMQGIESRATRMAAALDQVDLQSEAGSFRLSADATLALKGVRLALPDGRGLSEPLSLGVRQGERVLLMGASGTGKSTLMRAIAGIWPHWTGAIERPDKRRLLALPQFPYLPLSDFATAMSYPDPVAIYPHAALTEALIDVELGHLSDLVGAPGEQWATGLSGGERQRLSIARALLIKPDILMLDEATSAMDVALEGRIYAMLRRRLPGATILSIGHRESLIPHHDRLLIASASPQGGFSLHESERQPLPESA